MLSHPIMPASAAEAADGPSFPKPADLASKENAKLTPRVEDEEVDGNGEAVNPMIIPHLNPLQPSRAEADQKVERCLPFQPSQTSSNLTKLFSCPNNHRTCAIQSTSSEPPRVPKRTRRPSRAASANAKHDTVEQPDDQAEPERLVGGFSDTLPEGDPEAYRNIIALRLVWPPAIPGDYLRQRKAEKFTPILRHKGFDLDPLVNNHHASCEEFQAYAKIEASKRQDVYCLAQKLLNDMRQAQNQLEYVQSRMERRRTTGVRAGGSLKDVEATILSDMRRLDDEISGIAKQLRLEKADAEGLFAAVCDWVPWESKATTEAPPPDPELPFTSQPVDVQHTTKNSISSKESCSLPAPVNKSIAPLRTQQGLLEEDVLGTSRTERFKFMYTHGLSGPPDGNGSEPKPPEETPSTLIPEWFTILETLGTVSLLSEGPQNRYNELLNKLHRCEDEMSNKEYIRNLGTTPKPFGSKQYHAKHPEWPTKLQQEKGGWWACRSGPDASPPERDCHVCHLRPGRRPPSPDKHFDPPRGSAGHQRERPEGNVKQQYDRITAEIRKCMGVVEDMDKQAVMAQMNVEHADAEDEVRKDNWQWRGGWLAQGVRLATSIGSTRPQSRAAAEQSRQPQSSRLD